MDGQKGLDYMLGERIYIEGNQNKKYFKTLGKFRQKLEILSYRWLSMNLLRVEGVGALSQYPRSS